MAVDIGEKAQGLVELYRDAKGSYERSQVISHEVKSIKPSQVRLLVQHFYGNEVPTDHNDLKFLYKVLNFAIVLESGVLTQEQADVALKHQKETITKGPSSSASADEEDEDLPLTEGESMETQTERKKEKRTKPPVEKALEGKPRKRANQDWYEKDTKFIFTPDRTDYKPNSNSRPGLVVSLLQKPVTMSRLIDRFTTALKESDLGKGVPNPDTLGDRWIPGFIKWLMDEKKAVKVAKEGDEVAKVEKTEKKEKSKSKKRSKDAEV